MKKNSGERLNYQRHNLYGVTPIIKLLLIIFILFATMLPYLLIYHLMPEAYTYSWIIPPYPEDSLAYMAWSRQAANGNLLFSMKYTSLPHQPFFFLSFFLISGWINAISGVEIGLVLFLLKSIGVVLFLCMFFTVIKYFKLNRVQATIASIFLVTSSGFGAILILLFKPSKLIHLPYPIDLWMPESNTFWSLLWNPLWPYSLTLILLIVYLINIASDRNDYRFAWISGGLTALLALCHPYQVALIYPLTVIICAVKKKNKSFPILWRFFIISIPFVLHVFLLSRFHPLLVAHNLTGQAKSPPLLASCLGLGIPLLIVIGGVVIFWKYLRKTFWQMEIWIFVSFILSYFSVWFQRKLLFGIHIPICILSAIILERLFSKITNIRVRQNVLGVTLVILFPIMISTHIHNFHELLREVKEDGVESPYWIKNEIIEGMEYLKINSKPEDIVFASYPISRLLPAYSGNTVVWGHWSQSVDYAKRVEWYKNIFGAQSDWNNLKRNMEFWSLGIKYVFLEVDSMDSLHSSFDGRIITGTKKVFTNRSVVIYKIELPKR